MFTKQFYFLIDSIIRVKLLINKNNFYLDLYNMRWNSDKIHLRHYLLYEYNQGSNATKPTKNMCATYPKIVRVSQFLKGKVGLDMVISLYGISQKVSNQVWWIIMYWMVLLSLIQNKLSNIWPLLSNEQRQLSRIPKPDWEAV